MKIQLLKKYEQLVGCSFKNAPSQIHTIINYKNTADKIIRSRFSLSPFLSFLSLSLSLLSLCVRFNLSYSEMDKFGKFSIINCTKYKLKGGQFIAKMPIFVFWVPHCGRFWSANQPRMDRFENFSTLSYTKLELKGGSIFQKKNCQLMYLRSHFEGQFEKWGTANWPRMDQF